MSLIKEVITEYYRIPLPEIMEDAKHGLHTHFEVPIVKIRTDDGREGVGYTYTGGFGGKAICSLIANELTQILIGKDASCVESIWEQMNWGIHYVARGVWLASPLQHVTSLYGIYVRRKQMNRFTNFWVAQAMRSNVMVERLI